MYDPRHEQLGSKLEVKGHILLSLKAKMYKKNFLTVNMERIWNVYGIKVELTVSGVGSLMPKHVLRLYPNTIRYDTIGEFNVDWKAEYSALSSTRSQKKKLKQPTPVPL